ncbi:MAG: hypothetical protein V1784_08370 [bacterium]
MSLRVLLGFLAALLLCASLPGNAREKTAYPFSAEWSLTVQLQGAYLDNILRLSEADVERFQHGPQPFETPLKTYDDWKNELTLQPRFALRLPSRQRLNAIYSFKLAQHARNGFLDYQTHTLNLYLRPSSVRYPWVLNFRVFTIPSYYLRSHYDRDMREFHAARFQNWQYRFAPRFRFWKPLWIELRAEFETLYYSSKFTEYDCETSTWGIGGDYNGLRPFTFTGYYLRNRCDNIGYRQIGSVQAGLLDMPGVDTEYGDATYEEDEVQAEVTGQIGEVRGIPLSASLGGQVRRRVYTTGNSLEVDPFHRGRLDVRWKIAPSVAASISDHATIEIGYAHEERETISDVSRVEDVKNFRINQAFVAIEYRFK